jgi:hypothetical protein
VSAAPDVAGVVEGWRVWLVARRRGEVRLAGVVYKAVWPPGEPLVAECLRRSGRLVARARGRWPHAAPGAGCTCGIYATQLERVLPYLEDDPYDVAPARVLGRVALWGTVVECERGWRASHAYPSRLLVALGDTRSRIDGGALALDLTAYGVPVEIVDGGWRQAVRAAAEPAAA